MVTDRDWLDVIAALDIQDKPDFRMASRFVVDTTSAHPELAPYPTPAGFEGGKYDRSAASAFLSMVHDDVKTNGTGWETGLIVNEQGEILLPSNPSLLSITAPGGDMTVLVWSVGVYVHSLKINEQHIHGQRVLQVEYIGLPDGALVSGYRAYEYLLGGIMRGAYYPADYDSEFANLSCVMRFSGIYTALELINNPSMHIVESFPTKKMNDVRWRFSRSHYYVVSAEHNRSVNRGERIALNGIVTRAMHWRRAHFRTLRSERWKASRGKRVWIRRAWIGPTTWIGMDDKTYVVVSGGDVAAHRELLARRRCA